MISSDDAKTTPPDMNKVLGRLITAVYVIGCGALLMYVLIFAREGFSTDPADWGTLGDYFGGLMNPVISFATLFVAYAVWKQQREELQQTKTALEDQAKTAEQQRQEQRFFDLLNLYQQTISAISVVARVPANSGDNHVQYSGKEAIAQILRSPTWQDLIAFDQHGYGRWTSDAGQPNRPMQIKGRVDLHPYWNREETSSLLDHYFRVVFRILSEAEHLLGEQHIRYVKLFRAQLSRAELIVIGFNLWLDDEGQKLIPLAEKYGLLKHLSTGHLRTELETCRPLAFGQKFATTAQRKNAEATPC